MALDLRLQQKMVQQLVMTPQLQQAIKLLQLSHLEMADALRDELEQNPLLEDQADEGDSDPQDSSNRDNENENYHEADHDNDDGTMGLSPSPAESLDPLHEANTENSEHESIDAVSEVSQNEIDWDSYLESSSYTLPPSSGGASSSDELPPFETMMSKPASLGDHLRWQVQMLELTENELPIAAMLIEELNDDGYLPKTAVDMIADELGVTQAQVESVLAQIQELDPLGVGARDVRECLLIQAQHLSSENSLVLNIIDRHLPSIEKRKLAEIARDLKVSQDEVAAAIKVISHLEPRPGRIYTDKEPQYISPDIYLHKVGDEFVIQLNEDGLPRLRISNYYRDALQGAAGQTKTYIQDKLRSAAWLIRSIHMRQRTIYRVMESILKYQRDFFDKGVAHLKPLILKDIAEDVGMHESTISRVTANKYVHTPQGIYELKYFFNSSINRSGGDSIASESVRDHIQRIIGEEEAKSPVSDQEIVEMLKAQNIDIARRTVAKYREMLKIPSSSRRKRVF